MGQQLSKQTAKGGGVLRLMLIFFFSAKGRKMEEQMKEELASGSKEVGSNVMKMVVSQPRKKKCRGRGQLPVKMRQLISKSRGK